MADQEYKKLRIRDRADWWRFVMQKTLEEERNVEKTEVQG